MDRLIFALHISSAVAAFAIVSYVFNTFSCKSRFSTSQPVDDLRWYFVSDLNSILQFITRKIEGIIIKIITTHNTEFKNGIDE